MLPDEFLIRGKVDTVYFVTADEALDPLNFYAQFSQNADGTTSMRIPVKIAPYSV